MRKYESNMEIKNGGEIVVTVTKETDGGKKEEFEIPIETVERFFRKLESIEVGDEFEGIDSKRKFVVTGIKESGDTVILMDSEGDFCYLTIKDLKRDFKPTGTNYPTIELVLHSLKADWQLRGEKKDE